MLTFHLTEIVQHDLEWLEWLVGATAKKDEVERKRCARTIRRPSTVRKF
jgi:hypothetical protein